MRQSQYKEIVSAYKDLVYNQAYYYTGNKEDAEDITQEVLMRLWHKLVALQQPVLKAWIMKVTRNLCIDISRKRKKNISIDTDENQQHNSITESLSDCHSNPESQVIQSDLREYIIRIIKYLPEKIRTVVIMRDIQDMKYELISATIGLPINSVKVYLHRGRKLLLKKLSKHFKNDFQLE